MNLMTPLVVLLMALSISEAALAGSSPATSPVKGNAPVLRAPSSGVTGSVDFSGTFSSPSVLSTGDTVVMTWQYADGDGDLDDTPATVVWRYLGPDGQYVNIPSTDVAAPVPGGQGTSTITIPAAALGATAISVTVQAQSQTGLPGRGDILEVADTSTGAGGLVTPPGPVRAGGRVVGGIFLASDSPAAGSGALDYARTNAHPQVGETYLFRAWEDVNQNGVWDAGETDLTGTLTHIQWMLDGSNTSASGNETPATLSHHAIPGATSDTYSVPANNQSSSGAIPGDQGFTLVVEFH